MEGHQSIRDKRIHFVARHFDLPFFALDSFEVFFFDTRCCGGALATAPAARSKRSHASGCNSTLEASPLESLAMSPPKDGITITKLDAAQRQLRTAIHLWFQDGDPVSIHALLAAAHEIIHRLYRNKGLVNLMFDSDLLHDESRGYFAKKMKEAPNFFKHASQTPEAPLTFYPEVNDILPLFLIQGLADMGETLGLEERALIWWLTIHDPTLFISKGRMIPVNVVEQLRGVRKQQFFKACELLWAQEQLRDVLGPRPLNLKGR